MNLPTWNETTKARVIGEARLSEAKGEQFKAGLFAGILIYVSTGAASNLLTELIKDVIRRLRDKKSVQISQGTPTHKHMYIEHVKMPDDTEMLVVDIVEE